ncbi:MAG: hypothetical protein ACRDRT_18695, partial [Pseudonocardiaceae bacterium]
CARGVPPRRIFERDVGPSAVVLGSLLHGCYMAWTLPVAAGPRRRNDNQEAQAPIPPVAMQYVW